MRDADSVRTEPLIGRATPDDAEAIASVLNAVILAAVVGTRIRAGYRGRGIGPLLAEAS